MERSKEKGSHTFVRSQEKEMREINLQPRIEMEEIKGWCFSFKGES